MLRFGIVSELGEDEHAGFARVSFDEVGIVSWWLPLPSCATKTAKNWIPIEINSQVACLMDDDFEQGCIVSALWSNTDTPPDWANENTIGIQFADGAKLYYDFDAHKAIFEAPNSTLEAKIKEATIEASGKVSLKCSSLDVDGNINVTGNIKANGNMDADGNIKSLGTVEGMTVKQTASPVTLGTHMHVSAAPGSPTSPPTPGT